ncbi:hypothetical protein KKC15_06655 [bacterium]|nr:hypothetical protein [bacterium]
MRYLITLKPLEPFLFGGDNTYGNLGDKENGTYLVHSRLFPQQSAILGMLKKEMMTQAGFLTRKIRGEWVDQHFTEKAKLLVGSEKFNITSLSLQSFGAIKNISPIFIRRNGKTIIKQANIQKFKPKKVGDYYLLDGYSSKEDIFDNFVEISSATSYKTEDIFSFKEQTLNQKEASENSLYKKTSCTLKEGCSFAFYIEVDYDLKDSIITLGADRSSFKMQVLPTNETLQHHNDYLILLSDSYITVPLKGNCDFAITSEISYSSIIGKKGVHIDKKTNDKPFGKSDTVYLYEKGSIFINCSQKLLDNLNNKNLQKIGYNIHTQGENK